MNGKRILCYSVLITCILISSNFAYVQNSVIAKINRSSDLQVIEPSFRYMTPTDFTWTAVSIETTYSAALSDITTGDYFDYSISDSMIYLHELDASSCWFGVYATIPVTNDHIAFSCEIRATSNYSQKIGGSIRFYDPITLAPVENIPSYKQGEVGLYTDTGFDYLGGNFSLLGYDEVIIFILMIDTSIENRNLESWFKDLRIYTSEALPLSTALPEPIAMNEYEWVVDTFEAAVSGDNIPLLEKVSGGEFSYDINETHVFIEETGSGTYDASVGAYTTIPLDGNNILLSFELKSDSDISGLGESIMHFKLHDPTTMERIYPHPVIWSYSPTGGESGYHYFELNLTLTGYDEVIIFFFFRDLSLGNDNHKLWITNFRHQFSILDEVSPNITSIDDYTCEEGSIGNYINWTIQDENPKNYSLYRGETLLLVESWFEDKTVTYNVDLLPLGVHNYTLVAYDTHNNREAKTILVYVVETTETAYYAILMVSVVLVIVSSFKKKKRKEE